jgi:hypothetical protein
MKIQRKTAMTRSSTMTVRISFLKSKKNPEFENMEKAKAKGKISENKKKDVPSRTVNQYSSMSTKNIKKTDKYSTRVSNAREKELESMKNNGKKYRKGSLTAIANMNIEAAETDPDQKK